MGDITTSKNFTAGETVTASDLNAIMSGSAIAAGVIVNADVNASAAIALSKLNTADDMDANSYQVGASTVIDSSSNLTNINNATVGGTLGVTGNASFTTFSATSVCAFSANVDFTGLGATTDLHAGVTNLGASATQQINMNGTFAGSPTFTAATADHSADALIGLDGSTTNGPIKAFPLSTIQPKVKIAVLEDQKATTTHGGSSVAATWTKRTLNTEASDGDSIVTLSSDQFTPIAGTYLVQVESSFYGSGDTQLRLRNVTKNTTDLLGLSNKSVYAMSATMTGILVADGVDAFEVQYHTGAAQGSYGLGYASSSGETEVYTRVTLIKQA